MKFSLWTKYGARNSRPVFNAFANSVKEAGHSVDENDPDADVNVIWSVLWKGRMAPNKEIFYGTKPVIVLEVGGIIRGETWKVGLNGICREHLCAPVGNDDTRATLLGLELSPWRTEGDYILVCGQNPNSENWKGMPTPSAWITTVISTIRSVTDREIVIRHHPRAPVRCVIAPSKNVSYQQPSKIADSYDDFDLTFKHVHSVVSWSSNPGPQAIIQGIPAFVGPKSLAWEVANYNLTEIESPQMPDRQQWLNDYAHTEYTIEEIAQGIPLKNILKSLDTK